jgi:hypothetical protein
VNRVNRHVSFVIHDSYRDLRFVSRFTIQNFILLNVNNENEIYLSCTKFLPPHTKAFFIIFILLIANSTPPSNEERAGSIKK